MSIKLTIKLLHHQKPNLDCLNYKHFIWVSPPPFIEQFPRLIKRTDPASSIFSLSLLFIAIGLDLVISSRLEMTLSGFGFFFEIKIIFFRLTFSKSLFVKFMTFFRRIQLVLGENVLTRYFDHKQEIILASKS